MMSEPTNKWTYPVRLNAAQKARFERVWETMKDETMTDLSYNEAFIRLINIFPLPTDPEKRTIHATTELNAA